MFSYSQNGAFRRISEIPQIWLPLSPKGFPSRINAPSPGLSHGSGGAWPATSPIKKWLQCTNFFGDVWCFFCVHFWWDSPTASTAPGTGHSPSFGRGVRYSCLPPQTWAHWPLGFSSHGSNASTWIKEMNRRWNKTQGMNLGKIFIRTLISGWSAADVHCWQAPPPW